MPKSNQSTYLEILSIRFAPTLISRNLQGLETPNFTHRFVRYDHRDCFLFQRSSTSGYPNNGHFSPASANFCAPIASLLVGLDSIFQRINSTRIIIHLLTYVWMCHRQWFSFRCHPASILTLILVDLIEWSYLSCHSC